MVVAATQPDQAVLVQAAQRMEVYARRVLKTICRSAHVRLHSALLTGLTDDLPLRTWATASSTLRVSLALCAFQAAHVALAPADQPLGYPSIREGAISGAALSLPCHQWEKLSCYRPVQPSICPRCICPTSHQQVV